MRSKKMKRGGSNNNSSKNNSSKKNYSKLCKQKCKDKKYKFSPHMMKTFCGLKDNMCTFYESDGDPPPKRCDVIEFYNEVKKDKVKFKKLNKKC
jgi:hypothetical protein